MHGVELVDGPVGLDARVGLGHAGPVAEARLAGVARPGVDLRQADRLLALGRHRYRRSRGRSCDPGARRPRTGAEAGKGRSAGSPRPSWSTSMIETHVSRPIRSASASGPSGWLSPSFAIVSIASASATPSMSAYAASLISGMRMRLATKPGKSRASAGVLSQVAGEPDDGLGRLVRGLEAPDHLDERHQRHRIEEVHPDHAVRPRRGRRQLRDRDRGGVRGQDRLGRQHLVGPAEELLLGSRVFDDRLDEQVGRHEVAGRPDAPEHLVRRRRRALGGELLEACPNPLERPLDRAGHIVDERDAPAGGGNHLGDPAPHLPGADDQHVRKPHAPSLLGAAARAVPKRLATGRSPGGVTAGPARPRSR